MKPVASGTSPTANLSPISQATGSPGSGIKILAVLVFAAAAGAAAFKLLPEASDAVTEGPTSVTSTDSGGSTSASKDDTDLSNETTSNETTSTVAATPAKSATANEGRDADAGAGTDSGENVVERTLVSNEELFRRIRKDLEQEVSKFDRLFARYFSVVNLHNAGASDADLDACRQALARVVNSVSWERRLHVPVAIDRDKTIYRVDIRELDWDEDTWKQIRNHDPYAFAYTIEDAAICADLTDESLPVARADWFVANASKAPLYPELLELPDTFSGLLKDLRVRREDSLVDRELRRAGFRDSNETGLPRIVERYSMLYGSLWLAHDFLTSNAYQDIFDYPMGETEHSKVLDGDFTSAMFHLPNGMFAFAQFDAHGKRLDEIPSELYAHRSSAATETSGLDRNAATACITCHATGVIPRNDEVGLAVRTNRDAYTSPDFVLTIYDAAEMKTHQQREQHDYVTALQTLGIPSSANDDVADDDTATLVTVRRFRDDVDLRIAAAEFGLSPDDLRMKITDEAQLKDDLGPLLSDNKTITRSSFLAYFGESGETLGLGRKVGRASDVAKTESEMRSEPKDLIGPEKASIVSFDGQRVKLLHRDGKFQTMSVDALSTADQERVLSHNASDLGAPADLPTEDAAASTAGKPNTESRRGEPILTTSKATLVGFDSAEKVTIRFADGKQETVSIDSLHEDDVKHVLSHQSKGGSGSETTSDLPPGAEEQRRNAAILTTSKATLVDFDGAAKVTIRHSDGRTETVSIDSLHGDDVKLVLTRHASGSANSSDASTADLPGAAPGGATVGKTSGPTEVRAESRVWRGQDGKPIIEGRIHSFVRGTHVRVSPASRTWYPDGQSVAGEFRLAGTLPGGEVEVQILPAGQTRTMKVPMSVLNDADRAYLEQIRQGLAAGLMKAVRSPRLQYWEIPVAALSAADREYVQRMASASP